MNIITWKIRTVFGLLMVASLALFCALALLRSVVHKARLEFRRDARKGNLHRLSSVHQPEEPARRATNIKTSAAEAGVHVDAEYNERLQMGIQKADVGVKTEQVRKRGSEADMARTGKVGNREERGDAYVATSKGNKDEKIRVVDDENELKLHALKDHVFKLNIEEKMLNFEKFPVRLDEDGFVLAVQVHDRKDYFEHFITSLRTVRNIERSLVIISHDYYSPEMDRLVASIDVCKVVQIFYPYNMQMYPDKFPGQDPNDCPRDMPREIAKQSGCNNADHPDQFGHYREAKFTMTKHHWWWKVNHIFDHMRLTRGFNGYVIFLEEDHFLSPDFLYMAKLMANVKPSMCPQCQFLGMGNYDKVTSYQGIGNLVKAVVWESGKYNMGFAMNRESWNEIRKCNTMFCNFDDYNWDWTLQSLGKRCLNKPIGVVVVRAPRVFHIGQCGVHHKLKPGVKGAAGQCDAKSTVLQQSQMLQNNNLHLFPRDITLTGSPILRFTSRLSNPQSYGGWGDVRDHKLCTSYINNSYSVIERL